jgi:nucleoid-associated protein EbfC
MDLNPKKMQEMLEQAQKQAQQLQEQMASTIVEASAGGGTVTVKMNGQKRLLGITIDPEAVKSGDIEMLQDLITAAVNEGGRKAEQAMQSSVGGMLGGMGLPGLF